MSDKMIGRSRKILSIVLAALFAGHFAGITLFPHIHTDEWGREFTHSHPYSSDDHSHSAGELLIIAAHSDASFIENGKIVLGSPPPVSERLLFSSNDRCTLGSFISGNPLRGPPTQSVRA
ncbi:MAG: hypothetical protein FWE10_00255 [Rikenellaceae bacterium]|nr:hypothetical protein [Rikenellaceae bacterium]MCL2692172.1 hypothetical protein [Rikenellaceae bacterium]